MQVVGNTLRLPSGSFAHVRASPRSTPGVGLKRVFRKSAATTVALGRQQGHEPTSSSNSPETQHISGSHGAACHVVHARLHHHESFHLWMESVSQLSLPSTHRLKRASQSMYPSFFRSTKRLRSSKSSSTLARLVPSLGDFPHRSDRPRRMSAVLLRDKAPACTSWKQPSRLKSRRRNFRRGESCHARQGALRVGPPSPCLRNVRFGKIDRESAV